ncbi:MAG: hypothetical protein KGZ90_03495 [Algoriphagus sp.]|nr:hypothetical protein [Algoriphagus sp.]
MESRKEIHDRYINNLEKHISLAKESARYSSDRFDILLISLSTSSLILSIGFIEKIIPDLRLIDTSCLKTSWLLFVVSLISNLFSQVTGYYSNQYDIKVTKNLIKIERGKNIQGNQESLEKICSNLNLCTIILNILSLICLVSGIVILIYFISNQI